VLGVGIAARSQLGSTMYRNHERSTVYMERLEQSLSPVETLFHLDDEDRKTQYIAFTLTDGRPLERAAYAAVFGRSIDADFGERIDRLERGGLIDDDGERIALTETGMLVYDRVLLCFYPKRAIEWLDKDTVTADGTAAVLS
jgi:oxygen-independent coproporphyrinogen-3 oxidase